MRKFDLGRFLLESTRGYDSGCVGFTCYDYCLLEEEIDEGNDLLAAIKGASISLRRNNCSLKEFSW